MYLIELNSIDILCDSQSLGKQMHAQLGTLMERTFYPKLEKLLEQYDEPNHVWNINQLYINLPDLALENWKHDFVELALLRIEEYLKNNKPITTVFFTDGNNQDFRLVSKQQQAVELFFYYLKTGILPLNTIAKQTDLVWENIDITNEFITECIAFFEVNPERILRLVFGVSRSFRARILHQIIPLPTALICVLETVLQPLNFNFTSPSSALKLIVNEQELKSQWIDFVVFTFISFDFSVKKTNVLDAFKKNIAQWNFTQKELAHIFSVIEIKTQSENEQLPTAQLLFVKEVKIRLENDATPTQTKEEIEIKISDKVQSTVDFHFISNAGLVLLHLFLKPLFEQLNLCQDNAWNDKKSQHKAILLTQFLVTGNTQFHENELILNKIFCGMEIDEEVNLKLKITQKEKARSKSLLTSVLQHWTAMNNSSMEALQESFLTRNGKLSFNISNSIELQVESKGVDVLLGQLPWGIGYIKTPWMKEHLICEWS